jgi:hypothetical protein
MAETCKKLLQPYFQGAMLRLSILTAERFHDDKTVLFEICPGIFD